MSKTWHEVTFEIEGPREAVERWVDSIFDEGTGDDAIDILGASATYGNPHLSLPACVICSGDGTCCGVNDAPGDDECRADCPECNGSGRFTPNGPNSWLLAGWGFCSTPKCSCNKSAAEACEEWVDVENMYGRCGRCGRLEAEHG